MSRSAALPLAASARPAAPSRTAGTAATAYIAGPVYDHVFFILAPVLALAVGVLATLANGVRLETRDGAGRPLVIALPTLLSSAFTQAHLVIVFFRSHLNREIFGRHRFRFVGVPVLLLAGALLSQWFFVALSVLVTWWDVYHSSLQTFGLGRMYDRRYGNDVRLGRRADLWLNLVLYVGPILAGVNLAQHLKSFETFAQVDAAFLASFGARVLVHDQALRGVVLAVGAATLGAYLIECRRLERLGYRFPPAKRTLYLATGIVSVLSWGFGSFGDAFVVMNFFHAWQYFAIVWWSERRRIQGLFRTGPVVALVLFVVLAFGYGFWRASRATDIVLFVAIANVVSVLHFWYDGFIWSVRRGDV